RRDVARRGTQRSGAGTAAQCCACVRTFVSVRSDLRVRHCRGATYSEYIFIEEYFPNLKDWWWEFRVRSHTPQGYVDSTVYEFTSIREYINAVYLRGVMMLHAVRMDIGTEAFFELLRRYADVNSDKIAGATQFWSLMTPEQIKATENTRRAFLRRANFISAGTSN
ncbi:gluzincin family metallopeptidase, partial [Burkholderia cenocepacia]|uniref:hypothetical protein n=1 Tax=Burkholderia cenocepacia TaxID=95486 RepID=UPI0022377212